MQARRCRAMRRPQSRSFTLPLRAAQMLACSQQKRSLLPRLLVCSYKWSECRDSNPGPHPPQGCALPGCATSRRAHIYVKGKIQGLSDRLSFSNETVLFTYGFNYTVHQPTLARVKSEFLPIIFYQNRFHYLLLS